MDSPTFIIEPLIGRLVFKLDVSLFKNVTINTLIKDQSDLTMTRVQKISFFFLILLISLLMLPSILPLGFIAEGKLRRHIFIDGHYVDQWILAIQKDEYEAVSIVPKWKNRK